MRTKNFFLTTLACISAISISSAQTAGTPATASTQATALAYDVMTIKPNNYDNVGTTTGPGGYGDSFIARNITLKIFLQYAYDLSEDAVVGIPPQLGSKRFDIKAKISEPDLDALKKQSPEQHRLMILPLLTERFQLKTHMETRTGSIYELVEAKGGSKLKPSTDQAKHPNCYFNTSGTGSSSKLTAKCMPIAALAKVLTDQLHRLVVDKTALTGNYDLTLQWTPDDRPPSADSDSQPSIYTAIQEQLGLKLQAAKAPVQVLVVDHAAIPSEN